LDRALELTACRAVTKHTFDLRRQLAQQRVWRLDVAVQRC